MEYDSNWKPALAEGIKVQAVGDEVILLDRASQRVHQLDHVGANILGHCDGTVTLDDIVAKVLDEFEADEDQIRADVSALLGRMRVLNILL